MEAIAKSNGLEPQMWSIRHQDYLSTMARRKLPSDLVEDIVQDTFLAALKAAPRFRGHSSERVWLTAILNNKITDHYRKANTQQGKLWQTAIRLSDYPAWRNLESPSNSRDDNDVMKLLYASELDTILNSGLELLCKQERKVLSMKINGCSTEEICSTLGINKLNSWVALSRARKKIRHYLNHNWYEVA
ncbi:RNA polymerase sigma factor [Arenibacter troitsensis]|uniref:RNA polymerase sigma-70 factor, ECF subfamily n=1 Tax=Arenibacter troitsensis TaxID=188872 RepID=A0A1X7L3C6_9FLAO|nr:RNA polymerase sigma factor [Arenibacter troitsensis]SMG48250.1 RNA polymerase sigma-70 factor, ECF subfamily [Arenibacter troitsensis]